MFNSVLRKGVIGSYKKEMAPHLVEKFDKWTQEYNEKHGMSIRM